MWNPSDSSQRARAALGALALVLVLAAPGWSRQADPAAPSASTVATAPADRLALRDTFKQRYQAEALPEGGVRLVPRADRVGVSAIELSSEGIKVNGARTEPEVLTAWLRDDARPILALAALSPAEQREVLGLPPAPVPATDLPLETVAPDVLLEVPEAPEAPEAPSETKSPAVHSGSRVRFGGGITIGSDEVAESAVAIGGRVRVDGEVSDDVAAIGGPVEINGRVGGDVVAVGGNVTLGPQAEILGDVASVGGRLERAPGSKIHGSVSESSGPWPGLRWDIDDGIDFGGWRPFSRFMDFTWSVFGVVVLGLLVCLVLLLARQPFERVDRQLAQDFWKCLLAGFIALILFIPLVVVVSIVLVVSVIGCVLFLLYPFVALALLFFALLGYAASAHRLGVLVENRFSRRFGNLYLVALVGVVLIEVWSVLASLIDLGGGPLSFVAAMIHLFGFGVAFVAWTAGIGAVILSRFGFPPRQPFVTTAPMAPQPAAPPVPGTPGWPEPYRDPESGNPPPAV